MSTIAAPLQRASWMRPKYLLFAGIALMFGYVLVHNESFLVNSKDPVWAHYKQIWWWLLPHGMMGACALFLAPMQFSDRLRQRFTKLHRVVGRFYVAGVFFAAPLGAYMQFYEERMGSSRSFSIATIVDATLWVLTTAIAMYFILNGKVQQHRQWMTRSFAVALVFLEVRLLIGITGWEKLGEWAVETGVWTCLAFSLLFADIILQWRDFKRRPVAARVPARVQVEAPAASD
jgi:uncharacterized membrane protein